MGKNKAGTCAPIGQRLGLSKGESLLVQTVASGQEWIHYMDTARQLERDIERAVYNMGKNESDTGGEIPGLMLQLKRAKHHQKVWEEVHMQTRHAASEYVRGLLIDLDAGCEPGTLTADLLGVEVGR